MNPISSKHEPAVSLESNLSEQQANAKIEELRSILMASEREEIKQLQQRFDKLEFRISDTDTRAKDTSDVLEAATQLSNKKDEGYGNALKPMIVEQFQNTSRENPEIMAEALFPILGPAIRKMIASMFSRDTKKPKRSYKFEQLFLIEKASGLPICHAKSDKAVTQDADMVSGMLSAIQSFVQDAFSTQEFDSLDTLQLGDLSVWIEWGPDAVIAAVVRGIAPEKSRTALQQLLEEIHSEYGDELKNYSGDAEPFENVKTDFSLFMENHDSRLRSRVKSLDPTIKRNLALASIAALLALVWLVVNQVDKRNWANYVAKLDAEPGIVITEAKRDNGNYIVRGLRDPLAIEPTAILAGSGIEKENLIVELEPYQAMHPKFALQRIEAVLMPPTGTTLNIEGNSLVITGATSKSWVNDAIRLGRQFPEIKHVSVLPVEQ